MEQEFQPAYCCRQQIQFLRVWSRKERYKEWGALYIFTGIFTNSSLTGE